MMKKGREGTPAGGGLWKNEKGQFRLVWLWLAGFGVYALLNRGAEAAVALGMHQLRARNSSNEFLSGSWIALRVTATIPPCISIS